MTENEIGVHRSHCCILHGCKYGDENCPVKNRVVIQTYPCEECNSIGVKTVQDLFELMNNKKKTCPNCGHILE
jgi:hypothetical protein